jgi:hypothetical protein
VVITVSDNPSLRVKNTARQMPQWFDELGLAAFVRVPLSTVG